MGEQVLDLDLSTSSLFVSTLYKRFFSNQAPLLQIRGQMCLLHGCTILGYFGNRCDWPPLWWQIDGWTLCDSSWMFRVLKRWWWCSAEKCCATGMAISCSRGPKSGHSRFLPARDACKLDTANTRNCLFSPDGLWWFVLVPYVLFIPTENLYLFFTRNLAFMFTIYSHFTVLWADMWEAGWQMFDISCLNTFARMMNVEITSLSLSLWTPQLFSFSYSHSKSMKNEMWYFLYNWNTVWWYPVKGEVIFC